MQQMTWNNGSRLAGLLTSTWANGEPDVAYDVSKYLGLMSKKISSDNQKKFEIY
jgi:hypothetical protein